MPPSNLKLNHEYHVIELNNVAIPPAVFDWLKNNCSNRWFYSGHKIYFEKEADHMMFCIRWSA